IPPDRGPVRPPPEALARGFLQPGDSIRFLTSVIPLPDGQGAISLRTGRLERAASGKGWPVQPDHSVKVSPKQIEALYEWLHQKDFSELPPGQSDQPPEDPQL